MLNLNRYSPYWMIVVCWLTEHDWGPFWVEVDGELVEVKDEQMCHRCGKVVPV